MEVRTQKRPLFARVLWYFHMLEAFTILCCLWRRLSLLFYKTFAMIIFLSLKYFSVYFSMDYRYLFLSEEGSWKYYPTISMGRLQLK